jgi:hypothetical protein
VKLSYNLIIPYLGEKSIDKLLTNVTVYVCIIMQFFEFYAVFMHCYSIRKLFNTGANLYSIPLYVVCCSISNLLDIWLTIERRIHGLERVFNICSFLVSNNIELCIELCIEFEKF